MKYAEIDMTSVTLFAKFDARIWGNEIRYYQKLKSKLRRELEVLQMLENYVQNIEY